MIKIVFVGDAPSKTNVSTEIPFVGARSLVTLVEWIKAIKPDYYVTFNSENIKDMTQVALLHDSGFKVIALGKNASKRLYDFSIRHYEMYHPSGLNRELNKKEQVQIALKLAYDYVRM